MNRMHLLHAIDEIIISSSNPMTHVNQNSMPCTSHVSTTQVKRKMRGVPQVSSMPSPTTSQPDPTIAFPPYDISSHQNQPSYLSPLTAFLSLHYWPFASHGRRHGHVVRGASWSCSLALPLVPKLNACVPNSRLPAPSGRQMVGRKSWDGFEGLDIDRWLSKGHGVEY